MRGPGAEASSDRALTNSVTASGTGAVSCIRSSSPATIPSRYSTRIALSLPRWRAADSADVQPGNALVIETPDDGYGHA